MKRIFGAALAAMLVVCLATPGAAQSSVNGVASVHNYTTARTIPALAGVTCNATGTIYSTFPSGLAWLDMTNAQALSVWVSGASASGTINVNVYLDVSPLASTVPAANSSDKTQYVAVLLTAAAIAADGALYHLTSANTSYDDFNYPIQSCRLRVVGTATNPADSVISAWITVAE